MAEDEKLTIRDILVFPIVVFGWTLLNLGWRWDAIENQRKRQKRAELLEAIVRKHQAALVYEVNYPKNDNVSIDLDNLIDVANWLRENVGQQGVVWDLKVDTINHGDNVFIFRDEKYAAAFKLAFT